MIRRCWAPRFLGEDSPSRCVSSLYSFPPSQAVVAFLVRPCRPFWAHRPSLIFPLIVFRSHCPSDSFCLDAFLAALPIRLIVIWLLWDACRHPEAWGFHRVARPRFEWVFQLARLVSTCFEFCKLVSVVERLIHWFLCALAPNPLTREFFQDWDFWAQNRDPGGAFLWTSPHQLLFFLYLSVIVFRQTC